MRKIVLFALLGLLCVSCSDDDPTPIEQDIIGVWQLVTVNNHTVPAGTPMYIRFDGVNYYSSDTETNPTSNAKTYSISFNKEVKKQILNINGDSREFEITLNNTDGVLALTYVVTPADPENGVEEQRQSLPYERPRQTQQPTP